MGKKIGRGEESWKHKEKRSFVYIMDKHQRIPFIKTQTATEFHQGSGDTLDDIFIAN